LACGVLILVVHDLNDLFLLFRRILLTLLEVKELHKHMQLVQD
jgi:hypothetical protein